MNKNSSTREWLFNHRKDASMTQLQVAERAGIRRSYYSMIETGVSTPSTEVAQKLGNILNFDWTIFFTIRGNYSTHKNVKKEISSY